MRGAVVHGVESGLAVVAGESGLVIAAHDEDDVVGGRGDRHRRQKVHREGGQADDVVETQERDNASRGGQLDEDHHQDQHHGHD